MAGDDNGIQIQAQIRNATKLSPELKMKQHNVDLQWFYLLFTQMTLKFNLNGNNILNSSFAQNLNQ